MKNIEQKRTEFDEFLAHKNFDLSNPDIVKKALELEKSLKKSQVV